MTTVEAIENRVIADWQQLAVTSVEKSEFLKVCRYIGNPGSASTHMISLHLGKTCKEARKALRRMEKQGYVDARSNGSNNIYWSLRP